MKRRKLGNLRRAVSVLLTFILITSMFTFVLPLEASAWPAAYPEISNKYNVTVYWQVDNDNGNDANYFTLDYWKPVSSTQFLDNVYNDSDSVKQSNAASSSGAHSTTFELPGPPKKLYYSCYGKTADKSNWYIKNLNPQNSK